MLTRQQLIALPKAHLHIHLEGAMRPATLVELCRRYAIERPADTRGLRFDDFRGFLDVYWAACECVRSRDDLARLIRELAEDAAAEGVWWIEPAFDADRYSVLRAGKPHQLFATPQQGWEFALAAAAQAGQATGVGIGFISAVDRIMPVETALDRAALTARLIGEGRHRIRSAMPTVNGEYPAIVGFGLHGNEQGYPPQPFAAAFAAALRDTGLLSTPHAGEIAPFPGGGGASVSAAIDLLRADRILHGVLAAADPWLVERLADEAICLDVCPSSNIALNVFPTVAAHPLPALLDAGVPCSLGSDDPLLFGADLVDEYLLCQREMEFDGVRLAQLAANSFRYSGAPDSLVQAGLAAVDDWLAQGE